GLGRLVRRRRVLPARGRGTVGGGAPRRAARGRSGREDVLDDRPARPARRADRRVQRRASTRASRFRVIATRWGLGLAGALGEALGTGSSPSSHPSVPVLNTSAPDRAV